MTLVQLMRLCGEEARRAGADPKTKAMLVRMDGGNPAEIRIVTREECYKTLGLEVPSPTPDCIDVGVSSGDFIELVKVRLKTPDVSMNRDGAGRRGNASVSGKRHSSTTGRE